MSHDDPTAAALEYMHRFGLEPKKIVWDEEMNRFAGPRDKKGEKSGWYRARPETTVRQVPIVVFGDWKTGVNEKWVGSNGKPDEAFDKEAHARMMAELEEQEKAKWEEVAEQCRDRWDEAQFPSWDHPYLQRKGVTEEPLPAATVRQEGDDLLIAAKGFEEGSPIMSLQIVKPDGTKLFVPGSRTKNTRTTVNGDAFHAEGMIYICEGWATGWTIAAVTGEAVCVAFSAYNLANCARYIREKYPECTIIVAGDNDRWSKTHKGPNPGLQAAQEAARVGKGQWVIPDFHNLESKPTDYNDLLLLEGRDQVSYWLDPANQGKAPYLPPEEDLVPEDYQTMGELPPDADNVEAPPLPQAEEEELRWHDMAPFRCLGHNRENYYYMCERKGQVVSLTASQHDRKPLLVLASLSWWQETFPDKKGVDWELAADALIQMCHHVGVYSPERVRGRGLWAVETEEERTEYVLHLGDRLLPPGKRSFVAPETYVCPEGRIYERESRREGPSSKRALNVVETRELFRLFEDLLWLEEGAGSLLAGWTVLAPFGGMLKWRPHVWLTGNTGAGKSTMIKLLVIPLLHDMTCFFEQATSEAGIRQHLQSDSLAVVYDEAEKKDPQTEKRIQAVLRLARSASSMHEAAVTAKGSSSGKSITFQCRSMFLMSSIGGALQDDADKQRFALITMKSTTELAKGFKERHWKRYQPRLQKVTNQTGRELQARTLSWIRDGRMEETIEVFREAATDVFQDPRQGDQFGTLLAGAWTLRNDDVPELGIARELIHLDSHQEGVGDRRPEGDQVLDYIMQQEVNVDTRNGRRVLTVGQLIAISNGEIIRDVTSEDANGRLKQIGIRTEIVGSERHACFAYGSEWIKQKLTGTHFTDLRTALRSIATAKMMDPMRFYPGLIGRSIAIPISYLDVY